MADNMADKLDYRALGLKCGLEIHQQLDSKQKLFCRCPTIIRDIKESTSEFFRFLRPTASEMGGDRQGGSGTVQAQP